MCPTCSLHVEDEDHIIRCRSPARQRIRMEWQKELKEYLSETHASPHVKYYICQGLFTWLETGRYQSHQPPTTTTDRSTLYAIEMQNKIGWNHFARG
jgi:hypothetical protein